MNSRRALLRWVLRVVRREWRQHLLVISMIAFGIAFATLLVASAVRFQVPPEWALESPARVDLWVNDREDLAEATFDRFETEVVAVHAAYPDAELQVSGRSTSAGPELRAADPKAPLGAVNFSLLEGRWPSAGEVALTSRAVDQFEIFFQEDVKIGQTRPIGGMDREIVGIWENPNNLKHSSVLVTQDGIDEWTGVRFLLPSVDRESIEAFMAIGLEGLDGEFSVWANDSSVQGEDAERVVVAGVYLVGTLLCLQIAILASAGFAILAHRRTRQFAMFSAMGANPRQLGWAMRSTGIVCGLAGGILGLAVGVVLTIVSTPFLQSWLNHRIGTFEIPWLWLAPTIPLGVVTAVAAAWWPARRIQKSSTVDAIAAGRPPKTGVGRTLLPGVVLVAVGCWKFIDALHHDKPTWVAAALTTFVVGCLLLVPAAISILGAVARKTPMAVLVAWRDINRNRSRSAGATAAIGIAIAIPFGLASFVASVAEAHVLHRPPDAVQVRHADDDNGSIALDEGPEVFAPLLAAIPGTEIVGIPMPIDLPATEQLRAERSDDAPDDQIFRLLFAVPTLNVEGKSVSTAYATPELLRAMRLNPPSPGTDMVSTLDSSVKLDVGGLVVEHQEMYAQIFPDVLLFGDIPGISREDVAVIRWFLTKPESFTQTELDQLESAARRDGQFRIDYPSDPPLYVEIRATALLVAALLGFGIVAISVALIRIEKETEMRALNAMGASPLASRFIGAATAVGLVIPAIAIAVPAVFLVLAGIYLNPNADYDFAMPWPELAVVVLVIPSIAGSIGWILTTTSTHGSDSRTYLRDRRFRKRMRTTVTATT